MSHCLQIARDKESLLPETTNPRKRLAHLAHEKSLAEDRTELAEDRTLLANERTFSGWVRTSLATIGIGIGFKALFGTLQPIWIPKVIATLFVGLGIMIIVMATWRSRQVISRLTAHQISPASTLKLYVIATAFCLGALALVAGIWILL